MPSAPLAAVRQAPVQDQAQTLHHWLRLLWNRAPALHLDSDGTFLAGGAIHLPARAQWQQHCAAAAHAAAHLVYSPARFDGAALVPIARTLLALLEDARVEALAMRELPGLARLWRPLHRATPEDGAGFEPLLQRLARALADPDYADPHPWVCKGRRLFWLDEPLGLLALRNPAALRDAALRLGHDIGQLRLPFNARGYRPAPAYRDDHRWMWDADQLAEVSPPPPAPDPAGGPVEPPDRTAAPGTPPEPPPDPSALQRRTAEWDHRIRRLRPDWCSVTETAAPPAVTTAADAASAAAGPAAAQTQALSRRLRASLRALRQPQSGRSHDGEQFDLDALLQARIASRLGLPPDARVYRAPQRQAARAAVWLLLDQSASSADRLGPGSQLQTAAQAAEATALALQGLGLGCVLLAFSSNGRHAVRIQRLPPPPGLQAAAAALRSAGSTRLGAALRHAAAGLQAERAGARWLLLLSDGQPHDIDVHDPRYLVEDARQAVQQARRRGLRVACLQLAARAAGGAAAAADRAVAQRIFGPTGVAALGAAAALPRALRQLLG